MIPKKWRLAMLNWLGAGYMRVNADDDEVYCVDESVPTLGRPYVDVDGLSFNVMPAQGGTIVQLRQYDRKNDKNNNSTHIIPEGQDVAEQIGKIVALELWKA